jgi:hypothetical protein
MRTNETKAKSNKLHRRLTAGGLAAAYVFSNVVGAHAAEASVWKERRAAADRRRVAASHFARLPGAAAPAGTDAIFPTPAGALARADAMPGTEGAASLSPAEARTFGWLPAAVAAHGDIRRIHAAAGANAPVVVHLQDVHEIEEAQRNLGGLVESLRAARRADIVGLEGAVGPFDLAPYRAAPPDVVRALAGEFMRSGHLTGPEAAAIAAPQPPVLWGVEDADLYKKHVDAFAAAERGRAILLNRLETLAAEAAALRDRVYSPALRALDDRRMAHLAKKESLGQYTVALWDAAADKKKFPNVALLVGVLAEEKRLDFKRVEAERQILIDTLVRVLAPAALDRLINESLRFRAGALTPARYFAFLQSFCRDHGVRLQSHPALSAYIAYTLSAEAIHRETLLVELDRLERAALTGLATTDAAVRLVRARRGLDLLEKLARHTMTPAEWATYRDERDAIRHIPPTLAGLRGAGREDPLPADLLAPFEGFCAAALERNRALAENLLSKMRAEKASTGLLVTGGFHTAGLSEILREKGVSFAVVAPRLSRVPEGGRPLDIFARAPLPIETLLAGDAINLAYAPLTQTAGTVTNVPQGPARQQAVEGLWDTLDSFLQEAKAGFQGEDLNRFETWASGFKSIKAVTARPVKFREKLDAVSVYLETPSGLQKPFVVLMAPPRGDEDLPAATPVYAGRFALDGLEANVRVYDARDIERGDLGEAQWLDSAVALPRRLLAALRRTLNIRRLTSEERRIEKAHRVAIEEVSAKNGIPVEKLSPILEHIRRTRDLVVRLGAELNLPLEDRQILAVAAAAHDMGKFHEDCVESILETQYHERGSAAHRAMAAHENAVFAMLARYQLNLGSDAELVLRAHSAIGPLGDQPLSGIPGLTERHIRLALILAMADVGDGYRDMNRDYLRARFETVGFPDAAALMTEFQKYVQGRCGAGSAAPPRPRGPRSVKRWPAAGSARPRSGR